MNRRDELALRLETQEAFNRIYKSIDFQNFVLPVFKKVVNNDVWPNPSNYKTNEEFLKAYSEEYYRTNAYKELLKVFSGAEDAINTIRKELEKPDRTVGIK